MAQHYKDPQYYNVGLVTCIVDAVTRPGSEVSSPGCHPAPSLFSYNFLQPFLCLCIP